jgi:hypothetical protein
MQDSMDLTGGTFLDATINNINGDDHTKGDRGGLIGNGQGFILRDDGTADNIEFEGFSGLGAYDKYMSCEAWVKPNSFIGEGIIFLLNGVLGNKFKMSVESGHIRLVTGSGLTEANLRSSGTISDGNWHHVACAVNYSSNRLSIFIDGELDSFVNESTSAVNNPTTAMLGSDEDDRDFFLGYLDEFRINHKERSPDWIKFCYENQRPNSTVIKVMP